MEKDDARLLWRQLPLSQRIVDTIDNLRALEGEKPDALANLCLDAVAVIHELSANVRSMRRKLTRSLSILDEACDCDVCGPCMFAKSTRKYLDKQEKV